MRMLAIGLILSCSLLKAQPFLTERQFVEKLNLSGGLPEKLLSTKSVVFHTYTFGDKELKQMQEYFQRVGIDAVTYFELDKLMAGADIQRAFADYLNKREIVNLVLMEKNENNFRATVTTFNGKESIVDSAQMAWSATDRVLTDLLKNLNRSANGLKRLNLLINDIPETGITINPILGKRNEFFAVDVKVDPLAVPKFGDPEMDKQLEEIFLNNYPLKYKLTEPGVSEKDLRKQGFFYVVNFVYSRGASAKELLGYNMTKSESAIVSITYPGGNQQLKNISSNTPVFKVYLKHIDSQNVFLGTKWDADLTWQEALINHIRGLKAELRIQ